MRLVFKATVGSSLTSVLDVYILATEDIVDAAGVAAEQAATEFGEEARVLSVEELNASLIVTD